MLRNAERFDGVESLPGNIVLRKCADAERSDSFKIALGKMVKDSHRNAEGSVEVQVLKKTESNPIFRNFEQNE
jgi:hypothetical protein